MVEKSFAVVPRDGFFFKDGRGWYTSASGRGHSLDWPAPPTMLGALRTTVGRLFEASSQGKRFQGKDFDATTKGVELGASLPLRRRLGMRGWGPDDRCWPVPADALYVQRAKAIRALQPLPSRVPMLGRDDDAAREALWRPVCDDLAKPEAAPRWWTDADMRRWLEGAMPQKHSRADKEALALSRRVDVHVTMNNNAQTAQEGMLFTSERMEPTTKNDEDTWEWAIGLSTSIPDSVDVTSMPWTVGSDRRIAHAHAAAGLFDAPKFTQGAKGIRLLVVTPAHFQQGWLPDGFSVVDNAYQGRLLNLSVVLRAAFVQRPMHLSGWDMANERPKPTRRLVPAGAVYFFEKTDPSEFTPDEIASLWFLGVGSGTSEGLGRVVASPWTPDTEGT